MAKKLGADCCVQVNKDDEETKVITCIKDTLEELPDVTIDCSGFESTVKLGLKVNIVKHHYFYTISYLII